MLYPGNPAGSEGKKGMTDFTVKEQKLQGEREKQVKISVKNLSFSYSDYRVLDNISFQVFERDIITVVGPNGGGKTTLLKLILGLLKAESGTIEINSTKKPGYVPQYTLFDTKFPATVLDVVLAGRINDSPGFYTAADREHAEIALSEMKLLDFMKRPFSALSGGQRQRVLIARALAGDPDILLLDEPTANVDAAVGSYLSDYILNLDRKFTIMLVTHDMGFVNSLVGRVFCINRDFHEHPLERIGSDSAYAPHMEGMQLVRHDISLFNQACGHGRQDAGHLHADSAPESAGGGAGGINSGSGNPCDTDKTNSRDSGSMNSRNTAGIESGSPAPADKDKSDSNSCGGGC